MTLFSARLLSLICMLVSPAAMAGPYANKCMSAGNQAAQTCASSVANAGVADAAQAQQQINSTGADPSINPGGGAQSAQIAAQQGRLAQVLANCEALKKQCESVCDSAKAGANAVRQQMPQEPSAVDQAKKQGCTDPLDKEIAQIKASQSQLTDKGKGTEQTKKESNGGSGAPPQSPPGGSGGSGNSAATPVEPTLNCDASGFSQYRECTSHFTSKCTASVSSDAACQAFLNNYCNLDRANNTADFALGSAVLGANDGNVLNFSKKQKLEVRKTGEGVGSDYCRQVIAAKFCEQAGRSQCPSCDSSLSSANQASYQTLSAAQNSCPMDPVFQDPVAQETLKKKKDDSASTTDGSTSSSGGKSTDKFATTTGASSGGGSGLGSTAGDSAGATSAGAVGAASDVGGGGLSGDAGEGGGGYGGGGGSAGHLDDEADENDKDALTAKYDAMSAKRTPASAVAGTQDVAIQYGPSIFAINTTAYQSLCKRGKLNRCR